MWAGLCMVILCLSAALSLKVSPAESDSHFEPQVAIVCARGEPIANYHPQYYDESGTWVSDLEAPAACFKDKSQILELCRKVYRSRNISNIVESSRTIRINNWCKEGHQKCNNALSVKPYRCLDGPFQSDALLVPEQCLFDHVHNASRCWSFDAWNATARTACHLKNLELRSFAILLPCGVDLFSGVEFVCCPQGNKDSKTRGKENHFPVEPLTDASVQLKNDVPDDSRKLLDGSDTDDEYDDDDQNDDEGTDFEEGYDEDDDEDSYDTASTSTTTTTTTTTPKPTTKPAPTPDPYLTHYDPKKERYQFLQAEQRLESSHKDRISKVMKDWSELEDKYQQMTESDPKSAEDFKRKMTLRFQKLVKALEEEDVAEKHQLVAVHQQRVLANINKNKREAMTCYTVALNSHPISTQRVQKCLEKLLRSLHKDRHHTLTHYKHLLRNAPSQAVREKDVTLDHLADIDRLTNQSLQMIERHPDLKLKVLPLMKDYIAALSAKDDTPVPLLGYSKGAEEMVLNELHTDVQAKADDKSIGKNSSGKRKPAFGKAFDPETDENERIPVTSVGNQEAVSSAIPAISPSGTSVHPHQEVLTEAFVEATTQISNNKPLQRSVAEKARIVHVQTHDLSHNEPIRGEQRSVYVTLGFAGFALFAAFVVALVVLRRRHARTPQQQGFLEVDQTPTPEERHVANMQINGYENPTYKYFETKE